MLKVLPEIQAWADAYMETLPPPHLCPYEGRFDGLVMHIMLCMNPMWSYETQKIMKEMTVERTMRLPKSGFSIDQLVERQADGT